MNAKLARTKTTAGRLAIAGRPAKAGRPATVRKSGRNAINSKNYATKPATKDVSGLSAINGLKQHAESPTAC